MKFIISSFNRIISMVSINTIALSLISVFISIYLLEIGYSLSWVIYYLMIHHITLLLFSFVAVFLSNKMGLVKVLFLRILFLAGYLLLLSYLPNSPQLFFIIPILSGIESAFYWMPLNVLLVRNTKNETMGRNYSTFIIIPKLVSIASPFIGAFIAIQYGFNLLFISTFVIFIIALIPLIPLQFERTEFQFSWNCIKNIYTNNKNFIVPEVIDNLVEDAMVLWSIFIFIKLESILHVGAINTLVGVVGIIFVLFLGRLTDTWDKHKLIKIGTVLIIFSWLVNYIIATYSMNPIFFYVGTVFITFALKIFLVPYSSILYNRARKDDAQFLVLREVPTIVGRQLLFIIALVFIDQLEIVFLFVAIIFSYFLFFNTKKLTTS